jgi:hypothetical protein
MPTVTVLNGPVDHDGARYENGAEIPRLSADGADALVAAGVAEAAPVTAKGGKAVEPRD